MIKQPSGRRVYIADGTGAALSHPPLLCVPCRLRFLSVEGREVREVHVGPTDQLTCRATRAFPPVTWSPGPGAQCQEHSC